MMLLYLSYLLCGIMSIFFWRILAVSLPVVCFLSLATCHHVDVVPIQFGFVCHPSGNRSWFLLISYKANLPCLVPSSVVRAICFSPACFSKFFHVNPAVRLLMHRFKPRRNIEKIEAWTTRAVQKTTDCQKHPKLRFHPKPSFQSWQVSTFLLKFSSFSGRTERVFEVRHYLRSQAHPSIPSSSDNRATFDASISSLPLPIWLDKKRLCSGAILLTFHQLFKNCNLRISTAPFPLTSTVLKSSFHRLSRFGSGSGPSMNNGASGFLKFGPTNEIPQRCVPGHHTSYRISHTKWCQ